MLEAYLVGVINTQSRNVFSRHPAARLNELWMGRPSLAGDKVSDLYVQCRWNAQIH